MIQRNETGLIEPDGELGRGVERDCGDAWAEIFHPWHVVGRRRASWTDRRLSLCAGARHGTYHDHRGSDEFTIVVPHAEQQSHQRVGDAIDDELETGVVAHIGPADETRTEGAVVSFGSFLGEAELDIVLYYRDEALPAKVGQIIGGFQEPAG